MRSVPAQLTKPLSYAGLGDGHRDRRCGCRLVAHRRRGRPGSRDRPSRPARKARTAPRDGSTRPREAERARRAGRGEPSRRDGKPRRPSVTGRTPPRTSARPRRTSTRPSRRSPARARSTRPCSGGSTSSSGSWIRSRANRLRPCGILRQAERLRDVAARALDGALGAWPRPRRRPASTRVSRRARPAPWPAGSRSAGLRQRRTARQRTAVSRAAVSRGGGDEQRTARRCRPGRRGRTGPMSPGPPRRWR